MITSAYVSQSTKMSWNLLTYARHPSWDIGRQPVSSRVFCFGLWLVAASRCSLSFWCLPGSPVARCFLDIHVFASLDDSRIVMLLVERRGFGCAGFGDQLSPLGIIILPDEEPSSSKINSFHYLTFL